MDVSEYTLWYKKESTRLIDILINNEIQIASKLSPILVDDLVILKDFMSGGKKIRGGLMNFGIHIANPTWPINKIFDASLSFEFLHSALLMQDDVIDKDKTRRGKPTAHVQYENLYGNKYRSSKKSHVHFGISKVFCISDWASSFGAMQILRSTFDPKHKLKSVEIFHQCFNNTAQGESLDVTYESLPKVSESEVLLMQKYKTAHYTFSDPIRCGYALGGGEDSKVDEAISNLGENIGIAFQIWDDILGLFGDSEILGKPVGSDMKRRKNTLLVAKALEQGNKKQRDFIKSVWGKGDLTDEEFEKVKDVIKETGSLKYSEDFSEKLLRKGKTYISKITSDKNYQGLLEGFADMAVKREK